MKYKIVYPFITVSSICIFLFVSGGCNKTHILSSKKMIAILHDTYLTESMYEIRYSDFSLNNKRILMTQNIMDKHGVTQAQFDSSLVWYSDNPELLMKINEVVTSQLKNDLLTLQKSQTKRSDNTQKSNFNIINSYSYLSTDNPLLNFVIDSTRVNEFPNFSFKFNTLGFNDSINNTNFVINYIYSDTIISDVQIVATNGSFVSNIKRNKISKSLKSINGYIHTDPNTLGNKKLLIYDIKISK